MLGLSIKAVLPWEGKMNVEKCFAHVLFALLSFTFCGMPVTGYWVIRKSVRKVGSDLSERHLSRWRYKQSNPKF